MASDHSVTYGPREGPPFADDRDHQLWLKYLELVGAPGMAVRLKAMHEVVKADRAVVVCTDGSATTAPLMVAAEAAAAADGGCDERSWREGWVRRLVELAVTWQEEPSTDGVVRVLTLTDRIIQDLKAIDAWPWPGEAGETASAAGLPLTYCDDDFLTKGLQTVQGSEYVVWQRLLQTADDAAVATRFNAIHAASQSKCRMAVATVDGRHLCFPLMIVSEGALAAREGKSETQWREEWTRNLVRLVTRWPDPQTIDMTAALLNATPRTIEDLWCARVWPWLGARKTDRGPRAT